MSPKKKGLGKGIDALFKDNKIELGHPNEEGRILKVDTNLIRPNKDQPRKTFDVAALAELTQSIEAHGIIQPILVREIAGGYEIIAGERRYRAAKNLKMKEVPCIVMDISDSENMLIAIIENMQREDLNPVEEAKGLNRMLSDFQLTHEEISISVGKSRPYISNAIRLLRLPEKVLAYMESGQLTAGHGRAILGIEGEDKQIAAAKRAVEEGLSVRSMENYGATAGNKRKKPRKLRKTVEVINVEDMLKTTLGTKVNLINRGDKGRIEIEFYSRDELERLLELLSKI